MALYYDLPVFRDVYKLILLIYSITKDFSKEYKYTLGQDLKRDGMVLMRSIYRANKAQNKKEYLETYLELNKKYNTVGFKEWTRGLFLEEHHAVTKIF